METTITHTSSTDPSPAIPARRSDWQLGPANYYCDEERDWWQRHEPPIDAWLRELEEAGDEWSQSAEHAAHCLLASRDEMSCGKNAYRWEGFCVGTFLFRELSEGGTVGIFGSVEKFLDQLVETLERFAAAGLISEGDGCRWVAEMRAARCDFLRYYDAATSEDEAIAIARRHLPRARRRI